MVHGQLELFSINKNCEVQYNRLVYLRNYQLCIHSSKAGKIPKDTLILISFDIEDKKTSFLLAVFMIIVTMVW